MVRNAQPWELGEPAINACGQPIIQDIAQKLNCFRANSDIDLPIHLVFPQDRASMAELARQLELQQTHEQEAHGAISSTGATTDSEFSLYNHTDCSPSSSFDPYEFEQDYPAIVSTGYNSLSLSPHSFANDGDLGLSALPIDFDAVDMLQLQHSSSDSSPWAAVVPKLQQQNRQNPCAMSMSFAPQPITFRHQFMTNESFPIIFEQPG